MKKNYIFLCLAVFLTAAMTSCERHGGDIVAGSSLIQGAIADITDSGRPVRTLIPPGMCPGHFDMKPSDVDAVARSKAFIIHDWQQGMASVENVIKAADISGERVAAIPVEGSWMIPEVYAQALAATALVLSEIQGTSGADYREHLDERIQEVLALGRQIKKQIVDARAVGISVIANDMQADFLKWAGFNVVATFGRPEGMSASDVEHLIRQANEDKASLIVDNLQSGGIKVGEAIAEDCAAVPIVLSNFPGGFENTESWDEALQKNVDILLDAAGQWKASHE